MAKTVGGALSLDVSGKIANTLVFAKWKGRQYVRQLVIPRNPKTQAQVAVRQAMKWGAQEWAQLTAAQQNTWSVPAATTNISPFNAFVSKGQNNRSNNLGYQRESPAEASDPTSAPSAPAANANVNTISVSWTDAVDGTGFGTIIYRSDSASFTPGPTNIVSYKDFGVLSFEDGPLAAGTYYYQIKHFDIAGVLSPASSEVNATIV